MRVDARGQPLVLAGRREEAMDVCETLLKSEPEHTVAIDKFDAVVAGQAHVEKPLDAVQRSPSVAKAGAEDGDGEP